MVTLDTYKGSPTITLKAAETDRYGLTFGVKKAQLILAHLDAIRAFVEVNASKGDA